MRHGPRSTANNREAVLRYAHTMKLPFPIEQEDADQLPHLIYELPTVNLTHARDMGWNMTATIPVERIHAEWRTFIILGLGYALISGVDGEQLARFRQSAANYRGLGLR